MTELLTSSAILMPIDEHDINPVALETLVGIARQLDCGLLGLILEDVRLQQVADLPFTTEIVLGSGRERGLARDTLAERHSKVALDTRNRLTELANKGQVKLSFDQATGTRFHSALSRNDHLDIFFPCRRRWWIAPPAAKPVIRRMGLIQSGGDQDVRVLDIANALAGAGLVREIYVLGEKSPSAIQLSELAKHPARICVQNGVNIDSVSVTQLIRRSPYDLLILPRDCLAEVQSQILDSALDQSGSQVLLVN